MTRPQPTDGSQEPRLLSTRKMAAAERGRSGEGYYTSEHNATYLDVFGRIAHLVGAKHRPVRVSRRVLAAYGATAALIARATGRAPDIDRGLATYMSVPQASDWGKAARKLDYQPGDLDRAISDAARWYDVHMPVS